MESASEAGEILVSDETARRCRAEARSGRTKAAVCSSFCGGPRAGSRSRSRRSRASRRSRSACRPPPPSCSRSDRRVRAPAGLRRVRALRGSRRAARTRAAAAAARRARRARRAVQRAADEHGVTFLETDIDRDGGRMIIVAGAPETAARTRSGSCGRARAAVDHRRCRSGWVSAGRVFAGEVGARFRRTYTILGKTAALAARLMAGQARTRSGSARAAFSRGARSRPRSSSRLG